MKQRTSEWFEARRGKVTASRVSALFGSPAARHSYLMQLVGQRLGMPEENYQSAAMRRGVLLEPDAILAYEIATDYNVIEVGFIDHPSISSFGASPDGLVADGCIEVKCLNVEKHLTVRTHQQPPAEYQWQIHSVMACTGALWCDYVGYHPADESGPVIIRVDRNDELIGNIEQEVEYFSEEVDMAYQHLRGMRNEP